MDAFKIIDHCKSLDVTIAFECDVNKPPEVSDEMIRFNGVGNEGHETFILFKKKPAASPFTQSGEYFYFCKTAHKPYDLVVGLILLAAAKNAPGVLNISSDGDWDGEWVYIRKEYKKLFGEEAACPFKKEKV